MRRKESEFTTLFFSESGTKEVNNDYFGYVKLDNYAIWVVADGYDSDEGANIASKISVESAIEYFTSYPRFNKIVISEIFKYVNEKVKLKQAESERYSLMNTSLLVVISNYNKLLFGNVGNTRLYHIQGGYIINQSSDDSISQLLVQENALDISDIKNHRQRNDLLQAIGDYTKIKPNISNEIQLLEGDIICLTTIGVWENIEESEIESELSKFSEKKEWIKSIKIKILGSSNEILENNTFLSINIDKLAPSIVEKGDKRKLKRIMIISLIILILIVGIILFKKNEEKKILRVASVYIEDSDKSLVDKEFDNANKYLEQAITEYKKIRPSNNRILDFFKIYENKKLKIDYKIKSIEDKMEENRNLKEAFKNINDGNILFNNNNFLDSSKKYEKANYILSNTKYMRDELDINQVIEGLKLRIESTKSLIEANNTLIIADSLLSNENYKLAKEKYNEASNIFLLNGKEEYAIQIERKMKEIDDKVKLTYDGVQLIENKADTISKMKPDDAREIYISAKQIYQKLGDYKKAEEIDIKIQEVNNRQIEDIKVANDYTQEGLNALLINDYSTSSNSFNKAKSIYQSIGDEINIKYIDNYLRQIDNLVKSENKSKNDLLIKEKELEIEKNKIILEKKKRDELENKIKEGMELEISGDQLFYLNRYSESVLKYSDSKKIYEQLKLSGNYDDQNSKIEYLIKKINKCEGFIYEEQGDKNYKDKKIYDAIKHYELSKNKFSQTDIETEVIKRIDKKLKIATKKANKKWWEIWKF